MHQPKWCAFFSRRKNRFDLLKPSTEERNLGARWRLAGTYGHCGWPPRTNQVGWRETRDTALGTGTVGVNVSFALEFPKYGGLQLTKIRQRQMRGIWRLQKDLHS